MSVDHIKMLQEKAVSMGVEYLPKLVLAIVTLVLGLWLIRIFRSFLKRVFQRQKCDESLQKYLVSLTSIALKILLIVTVIQMVGVKTTSIVAVIGAAGLAVGLALQGSLSNFAGGILILIFKPFQVGDYIRAGGLEGTVRAIQVFHTELISADGKKVVLPNGNLANNPIENFNCEPARRISFLFGIGYGDDIDLAKSVIEDLIVKDDRVLKDPKHRVAVSKHGDNAVEMTVQVWCRPDLYWDVYFSYPEKVKKAFDDKEIEIPYPQMVVHQAK
ncbi:MAG: mechanosensitive ion channel [Bdellovibrionales bacterium]|nr:mechanosensitive ion channel [Bdellovibrionales bacterium]